MFGDAIVPLKNGRCSDSTFRINSFVYIYRHVIKEFGLVNGILTMSFSQTEECRKFRELKGLLTLWNRKISVYSKWCVRFSRKVCFYYKHNKKRIFIEKDQWILRILNNAKSWWQQSTSKQRIIHLFQGTCHMSKTKKKKPTKILENYVMVHFIQLAWKHISMSGWYYFSMVWGKPLWCCEQILKFLQLLYIQGLNKMLVLGWYLSNACTQSTNFGGFIR